MRNRVTTRLICMLLVCALLAGYFLPTVASAVNDLSFHLVGNDAVSAPLRPQKVQQNHCALTYGDEDVVRVSIVLTRQPTLKAGFAADGVADNAAALQYRQQLK